MKKTLIVSLLIGLCSVVMGAEQKSKSFLDGVSLTTEGIYRVDISDGKHEWGAGLSLSGDLNKYVRLNIRGIAYETDNWKGGAIDELQPGVTFQLLSSKKITLGGEVNYTRSFRADDNGIGVGAKLNYSFTKNVSAFGGVQYRVYNKQANDLPILFGIGYKF